MWSIDVLVPHVRPAGPCRTTTSPCRVWIWCTTSSGKCSSSQILRCLVIWWVAGCTDEQRPEPHLKRPPLLYTTAGPTQNGTLAYASPYCCWCYCSLESLHADFDHDWDRLASGHCHGACSRSTWLAGTLPWKSSWYPRHQEAHIDPSGTKKVCQIPHPGRTLWQLLYYGLRHAVRPSRTTSGCLGWIIFKHYQVPALVHALTWNLRPPSLSFLLAISEASNSLVGVGRNRWSWNWRNHLSGPEISCLLGCQPSVYM